MHFRNMTFSRKIDEEVKTAERRRELSGLVDIGTPAGSSPAATTEPERDTALFSEHWGVRVRI